jgi:hypothetical protein
MGQLFSSVCVTQRAVPPLFIVSDDAMANGKQRRWAKYVFGRAAVN